MVTVRAEVLKRFFFGWKAYKEREAEQRYEPKLKRSET